MDKKASRGRRKEKCGSAKSSEMSERKTNRKETEVEAPLSRSHAGGSCAGTHLPGASKACLNGSPHLDIGKREDPRGLASVAQSESLEGQRQCKPSHEIYQREQTGCHRNEATPRNTKTESVSSTKDDACPEQLTPEQQRILSEKAELEQLLGQTKRLQQQAEMCLQRKDEKSAGLENKQLGLSKSSKELSPGIKESNTQIATVVPHEQKITLSAQAEPDGWPTCDDAEFSVQSENAPSSFRGSIQLREENAELHHKKVELGVLLQTAKVLLEKTDLSELNHNDEEELLLADNACDVSFMNPDGAGKQETNVEDDYEQSENSSSVKCLYEKADEITRKAKQFVDMLQEDKDLDSNATQSDLKNSKLLVQNSEFASKETDASSSKCLLQKEEECKASQAEEKGLLRKSVNCAEGDQEVKETDEIDDGETPDQKLELQRLLQQARQLLEKVNSPLRIDSDTKEVDKSLQDTEELTRTAENKALEGEMVSNLDQKEHMESLLPLGITAAQTELLSGVKKEGYLTGIEIDEEIQDPGAVELQPEEGVSSAIPGVSETVSAADEKSWSEVQTALLCEKNELSLLLMKTQLLQQKAEMIITRSHLQTGKTELKDKTASTSSKETQLSSQETTKVLHTAELTSEITKPHLEATGTFSKKLRQALEAVQQSSELTKEVLDTTQLSSVTTKPTLDTTEVSSAMIKSTVLDATEICSEATSSDLKTKEEESSELNIKVSDKTSLPQEKKSVQENLQSSDVTKYIDDIIHESNDLNRSDLRNEAISTRDDRKLTESLSNEGVSNEDTESQNYDDSESSDEDDPSFDSKEQLQLLLQRARLLIEKSKVPVSERHPSAQLESSHPPDSKESSEQEKESNDPEACTSETAAVRLPTEENESCHPKKQILNSKIMNEIDISLQQANEKQLSQDAELEFLLAKTKLMKLKADELLNQINVPEPNSDEQLPNSELPTENKVELKKNADKLHNQITVSETESDQQSTEAQCTNDEQQVLPGINSCATLLSAQGKEEENKDNERPKRPTELDLDKSTLEKNVFSCTTDPEQEIKMSTTNEDSQLELEEIEESQLEVSENEKSQFEIEEEYLSDNSELSDMNMYYDDDAEYSQDEEENLPEENEAISNEACLPQQTEQEQAGKKDTHNEKRELELLLEITHLLLEKATLPLELIETVPDENNSPALTESVSEIIETPANADLEEDKLNLSLHDKMPVLETKQMCSQKIETVTESTAMSSEKNEKIIETTEVPSQEIETDLEPTAMSSEKYGTVIETTEEPSQKTKTITETTSLEEKGTVSETTEICSEISKLIQKETILLSDISKTQPEASNMTHLSQEQSVKGMTSSELSLKLEQLKTEVNSFLQSELRLERENSAMADNSLENKTGEESFAGNNITLATGETEEAHLGHSTSEATAKGTNNEQGSEFQVEASAEVPVSQLEAGKAANLDSNPLKGWTPMTSYTLLLKLQNQMARMQLQLSNLQDEMRTTNGIIQQLMEEAFDEM